MWTTRVETVADLIWLMMIAWHWVDTSVPLEKPNFAQCVIGWCFFWITYFFCILWKVKWLVWNKFSTSMVKNHFIREWLYLFETIQEESVGNHDKDKCVRPTIQYLLRHTLFDQGTRWRRKISGPIRSTDTFFEVEVTYKKELEQRREIIDQSSHTSHYIGGQKLLKPKLKLSQTFTLSIKSCSLE